MSTIAEDVTARDLGRVLKLCRDEMGLSIADAAEGIGTISSTSLHRYERGERQVGFDDLLAMCRFYGLTIEDLVSRAATMRVWLNPPLPISLAY